MDDPQLLLYGQLLQRITEQAEAVHALRASLAAQAEELTRLREEPAAQAVQIASSTRRSQSSAASPRAARRMPARSVPVCGADRRSTSTQHGATGAW